jgi:hypothetical protein
VDGLPGKRSRTGLLREGPVLKDSLLSSESLIPSTLDVDNDKNPLDPESQEPYNLDEIDESEALLCGMEDDGGGDTSSEAEDVPASEQIGSPPCTWTSVPTSLEGAKALGDLSVSRTNEVSEQAAIVDGTHNSISEVVDVYPEGGSSPAFSVPHTLEKEGYTFSARRRGYMDSMALISAIDLAFYGSHQAGLGPIMPSNRKLRMADGSKRKSSGTIKATMILNYPEGGRVKAPFTMEVVDSGGSWDILFGLPLLTQMKAIIDFGRRVLIVNNREFPAYESPVIPNEEETVPLWVFEPDHEGEDNLPELTNTGAVQDRGREILKQIQIGRDLTVDQRAKVESFILEKHEAWALSLSELEEADVEPARIRIDETIKLPQEPTQRMSWQEAQAASAYVDVLLSAKLIRPIDPWEVKCVSNIIMVPKKMDPVSPEIIEGKVEEALEGNKIGSPPCTRSSVLTRDRDLHIPEPPAVSQSVVTVLGSDATDRPNQDLTKLYRMVFNFKPLNRAAKCAPYMPGNMQELIAKTSGRRYISIADQLGAFYSFPLHKDSQPYTTFFVPSRGHFCHVRMAQGLAGSPATMQTGAAKAYQGLLGVVAEIWMDDLFTSEDCFDKHLSNLTELANRAILNRLRWSPSKTKLFMSEAKVGGQIVDRNGVRADPERVKAIVELGTPRTALQVLSFVNKAAHFRRNIDSFAAIAAPLTDLTRSLASGKREVKGQLKRALETTNIEHLWTETQQRSFEAIKSALVNMVMTVAPLYDGVTPFHIAVDACAEGFGAHLYQMDEKGIMKTMEFASRRTSFHGQRVVLHTDCQAVKDLLNNTRPTFQQASWKDSILNCGASIEFVHKAGRDNEVADYLSRNAVGNIPTEEVEVESDLKGVVNDLNWLDAEAKEDEALRNRFKGDELYAVVCYLTKLINSDADIVVKKAENYWTEGGKLFTKNKAQMIDVEVVPCKEGPKLAKEAHEDSGHFGKEITIRHLQRNTTWSSIRKDVTSAIEECEVCMKFGPRLRNSLMRETLRYAPFELIALDYLFMPRTTDGFRIALIAVDSCSKYIFGWVFKKDPCSESCLTALTDLATKYMLPSEIVVDNQFVTKKIRDALEGKCLITPAAPYAHVGLAENAVVDWTTRTTIGYPRIDPRYTF